MTFQREFSPPSKQGAREKRFDAELGRCGAGVFCRFLVTPTHLRTKRNF